MTMNPEELPFVGAVFRFGANDVVLDAFLLAGPVVVLAMVVLGRTSVTELLAALYAVSFVGYVVYNGVRGGSGETDTP